ncbi:protein-L-isoaspartate(D-aspartate) O-methyltransferase [Maricaulis sp.]|uniref:protein-L-isoaspartate(D-aspartate) O-methyltransferase n=1 Tax=Maricaulis sp. TaxID=1486257 RepID=UPI001B2DFC8C|nr:protein-L-isoaspartate(D-aspartate) O-methyltransferase [Maricaulis sp.]MBO6763843.1 protein-L-isoaspartate(D-aspartate) O-methyltransferase [Maricaulis sp.]
MSGYEKQRAAMVERQVRSRGVRDPRVLAAMMRLPRERFLAPSDAAIAYEDIPLPIGHGQTATPPRLVAFMAEALDLSEDETALEVGGGSGYTAAVLADLCRHVSVVERIDALADHCRTVFHQLGITNIDVHCGDGRKGWPRRAPFDAILVSMTVADIPQALLSQLAPGGRLVAPVGATPAGQELVRITRTGEDSFIREDIADIRYVAPLGGADEREEPPSPDTSPSWSPRLIERRPVTDLSTVSVIAAHGETAAAPEAIDIRPLLDRIGDARVVLIGEATHGTHEFYALRARISRALIAERGFDFVAAEADWPDAARIDHYVRHKEAVPAEWTAFARFPTWMWRNEETRDFADWLHSWNKEREPDRRAGFHGLDLYSLYLSAQQVLNHLDTVGPDIAAVARQRYACLTPWETDPAAYGHAALTGAYRDCEQDVLNVLVDLLRSRSAWQAMAEGAFFDAERNARLVASAERYYRTMYYGSRASWNLRDTHMFETLESLLDHYGPRSRGIVWAHNSHLGDSAATEMSARGEFNIGRLARARWGSKVYSIGFGTDHGRVAAASDWDGPLQYKTIRPAHPQSYERLFHLSNQPCLLLPLRKGKAVVRERLSSPRLERAIGVIYRPESERFSHYFEADLTRQFDEYVWIDETSPIRPLDTRAREGLPDTYPFGL